VFGAPLDSVADTAAAAIAGSLVGAGGFIVGTWISARHQDRRKTTEIDRASYRNLWAPAVALATSFGRLRGGDRPTITPRVLHPQYHKVRVAT